MGKRSKSAGHERHDGRSSSSGGRKQLAEVIASLEKARAKRDTAQARVEALEALAEELATRMVSDATTASSERGRVAADAAATESPATP